MINLLNLIVNKTNAYQVNELVSRDHREKLGKVRTSIPRTKMKILVI